MPFFLSLLAISDDDLRFACFQLASLLPFFSLFRLRMFCFAFDIRPAVFSFLLLSHGRTFKALVFASATYLRPRCPVVFYLQKPASYPTLAPNFFNCSYRVFLLVSPLLTEILFFYLRLFSSSSQHLTYSASYSLSILLTGINHLENCLFQILFIDSFDFFCMRQRLCQCIPLFLIESYLSSP